MKKKTVSGRIYLWHLGEGHGPFSGMLVFEQKHIRQGQHARQAKATHETKPPQKQARTIPETNIPRPNLQRLAVDEFAEDGGRRDGGDLGRGQGDDVAEELEHASGLGVGR